MKTRENNEFAYRLGDLAKTRCYCNVGANSQWIYIGYLDKDECVVVLRQSKERHFVEVLCRLGQGWVNVNVLKKVA